VVLVGKEIHHTKNLPREKHFLTSWDVSLEVFASEFYLFEFQNGWQLAGKRLPIQYEKPIFGILLQDYFMRFSLGSCPFLLFLKNIFCLGLILQGCARL